jgi:hypothetical protein
MKQGPDDLYTVLGRFRRGDLHMGYMFSLAYRLLALYIPCANDRILCRGYLRYDRLRLDFDVRRHDAATP